MSSQKEFYFIRHGQTNHNIMEGRQKGDHPADIPLNETGRNQAKVIEPLVARLPVKTVCTSPMRRAQETKEIVTQQLQVVHYDIESLSECSPKEWEELSGLGMYSSLPEAGLAYDFVARVQNGLTHALSLPEPTLIIAHGGIHWAICTLLGIKEHNWLIENCEIVHFSLRSEHWIAKSLTHLK